MLTLNRNFVPAYANIAYAKLSAGSTEDAIQLLEEAIHRLSPRNSDVGSWYSAIGRAQLMEARADQAVFWLEKARGANPMQGPQPHAWLASAHALEGESERAAAELAEARRLSSDDRYSSIGRLRAVIAGARRPRPSSKPRISPACARPACRKSDRRLLLCNFPSDLSRSGGLDPAPDFRTCTQYLLTIFHQDPVP